MVHIVKFEDLVFVPHHLPDSIMSEVEFADGSSVSIVAGPLLYGDGVNTFETWFSDEDSPRGWQTKEELEEEFTKRGIPFINML
jgi:hypothetical protein